MSLALALGFFIAESGGKPSCRFFKMLFTRLKKLPSLPWLLSVLIIKACCMLSNTFNCVYRNHLEKARAPDSSPLAWKNPMDGGAWWAAVHGVAKSRTWLSDLTFTFPFHELEKEMAVHSSVLAWRIPGNGKPSGLPSMRSHRVRHEWSDLAAAA